LLFPKAADVMQPLAGEYAGRRSALETLPFVQGWGVEFGLLVDIVERFGRDALVQVDLGVREHRNRPLAELAPQAMAIITTALRRAGMVDAEEVIDLLRFDDDAVEVTAVPIEVRERPPILTLPEYSDRFGQPD
jgi:glucosyl-3-phosphoglycerate synthase